MATGLFLSFFELNCQLNWLATSELGPVDPQIAISEAGQVKRFFVYNIVTSYEELFKKAVNDKKGNLEPYLQQLHHYDERDIREFKAALDLSEDIALRTLSTGMMRGMDHADIKRKLKKIEKKIAPFVKRGHVKTYSNAGRWYDSTCLISLGECRTKASH